MNATKCIGFLLAIAIVAGAAGAEEPASPASVDPLFSTAQTYIAQRNYLDALAALNAVVEIAPDFAAARYELYKIYQVLGRDEKARAQHAAYMESVKRLMASSEKLTPLQKDALEKEIARFLKAWEEAWESRDIARYMAFYSPAFSTPDGMDRDAWREKKQRVFHAAQWISVTLKDVSVQPAGRNIRVHFLQDFGSNRLKDTGTKTLLLAFKDGAWSILSEEWHALP